MQDGGIDLGSQLRTVLSMACWPCDFVSEVRLKQSISVLFGGGALEAGGISVSWRLACSTE